MIESFMGLAAFVSFFGIFVYPLVVLRPFIRVVRQNREPLTKSRFSLLDLFSLMFVIQIPIALASFTDARIQEIPLAMAGFMLAGAIMWYAALRALNHIGVNRTAKRLIGIGYTFPAALIGGLLLPLVVMLTLTKLVRPNVMVRPPVDLVWVAVYTLVTFVTYKSAQWVVNGSALANCSGGIPVDENADDRSQKVENSGST